MAEPLEAISLVDISDLKNDLGIKDETTWDDLLTRIANGVTKFIERYCKSAFKARLATKTYDGNAGVNLFLEAPIVRIDSITKDGTAVSASDYALYHSIGKVRLTSGTWSSEPLGISVAYRYGYEDQDIPDDILLAARAYSIFWFQTLKDDRLAVESRGVADDTITFRQITMPDSVREMINPLKRMGVRR